MSAVALVVDDSMLIRYTVCRSLEERGFIRGVRDEWPGGFADS
jgi:CheY-like chemotaxis protein